MLQGGAKMSLRPGSLSKARNEAPKSYNVRVSVLSNEWLSPTNITE